MADPLWGAARRGWGVERAPPSDRLLRTGNSSEERQLRIFALRRINPQPLREIAGMNGRLHRQTTDVAVLDDPPTPGQPRAQSKIAALLLRHQRRPPAGEHHDLRRRRRGVQDSTQGRRVLDVEEKGRPTVLFPEDPVLSAHAETKPFAQTDDQVA